MYQLAVRLHFGVEAVQLLHHSIDNELQIAPYVETPCSKFDGDLQAVDEGFVLGCVVGGGEVEPNYVTHMHSEGEMKSRPAPTLVFIRDPSKYMVQHSDWI